MANQELIQAHLPNDLWEIAKNYIIPDSFLVQRADLIILVLRSKSMDLQEEKQSWFNLLPMMNQEQIDKLHDILTREKAKLEEIEQKYESKKDEIKEKYLTRRQNMWYVKKVNAIKEEESASREQEHEEADSLLAGI